MTPELIAVLINLHSVMPAGLVTRIIQVESSNAYLAISPEGAKGLMQVTNIAVLAVVRGADLLPRKCGAITVDANLFNPATNILAGTCYLRLLSNTFPSLRHVIMAFNAGPGRVQRYIEGEPLPSETQQYISRFEDILDGNKGDQSTQGRGSVQRDYLNWIVTGHRPVLRVGIEWAKLSRVCDLPGWAVSGARLPSLGRSRADTTPTFKSYIPNAEGVPTPGRTSYRDDPNHARPRRVQSAMGCWPSCWGTIP